MGELDGLADGGVGRCAEKEQLGDAEPQQIARRARFPRQGPAEAMSKKSIDLAEAAQRHGCQGVDEGAVARLEARQLIMAVEQLVERAAALENLAEQVEGDGACGRRLGKLGGVGGHGCPFMLIPQRSGESSRRGVWRGVRKM